MLIILTFSINIHPQFITMKTFSLKEKDVNRQWYLFDATDKTLGRFASKIADKLRGKDNINNMAIFIILFIIFSILKKF